MENDFVVPCDNPITDNRLLLRSPALSTAPGWFTEERTAGFSFSSIGTAFMESEVSIPGMSIGIIGVDSGVMEGGVIDGPIGGN